MAFVRGWSSAIFVHPANIRPITASGFPVGFVYPFLRFRTLCAPFDFAEPNLGVISNLCLGILGMLVLLRRRVGGVMEYRQARESLGVDLSNPSYQRSLTLGYLVIEFVTSRFELW